MKSRQEEPRSIPALAQVLLLPRVTVPAGKLVEGMKKCFLICSRSISLSGLRQSNNAKL